jgi:uncharacterized protein
LKIELAQGASELRTSFASAGQAQVAPAAFHVMMKPRGAICNLDCKYCYFLSKEMLYPGSRFRMADGLLEEYTKQYIAAQHVPEVTFAWQGGEPTLMGLEFFQRAVALQQHYRKPGMKIYNAFQTNGVLLDDAWCKFFRAHDFLIGLSMDGPPDLHDHYRVDKGGAGTHHKVLAAARLLQKHRVEFNILTTVHAGNVEHPLAVYRYLRDVVGTQYMQFIPIVERDNDTGYQEGDHVTDRSLTGAHYGQFLTAIFDEWVRRDVGRVFVQIFDVALAAWSGARPGLCIFEETCGNALALEHNGDLYSCDHFVEPAYRLGNVQEIPLVEMVGSEFQRQFGLDKRDTLPKFCRECEVRFVCNGGCPKDRILQTPDGEPGLNYLCAGFKHFFTHIDRPMRIMAGELHAQRPPANIMRILAEEEAQVMRRFASAQRNDPCPCGSGRKFKQCHGRATSGMATNLAGEKQ